MHAPGPVPVTFFSRDFVSSPQGMVTIKSSGWAVRTQVRMRSKAHWFFCLSNIFGVLSSAWVLCMCWHLVWMALPFCFSFTAVCSDHTPLKVNSSGITSLLSLKQLLQHGRIAVLQRLSSSNQVEFAEFADKYALRSSACITPCEWLSRFPKSSMLKISFMLNYVFETSILWIHVSLQNAKNWIRNAVPALWEVLRVH